MRNAAVLLCVLFLAGTSTISAQESWFDNSVIVGVPDGFDPFQEAIGQIEEDLNILITPEDAIEIFCAWYVEGDEINAIELHEFEFQGLAGTGPTVPEVIAAYESVGLHAEPRYMYETFQSPRMKFSHREPVTIPDSLFLKQVPYPLGGTDPETGFRYTKIVESWGEVDTEDFQEVVLQINDTGVWWYHKDFGPNLWQNLGEDLNNDGSTIHWYPDEGIWYFDAYDINGIDDDGNGLVDDFIGINAYPPVHNDPAPVFDHRCHGTMVASVAGAVTGNWSGMSGAAVPGVVKIQPVKCGNANTIDSWAAVRALNYAVWTTLHGGTDRGPVPVVVNMSWGGLFESRLIESMLDCFTAYGGIPVFAAGNFGSSWTVYPAAYHYGPILTASTKDNVRAVWSSYGPWMYPDGLAAPGKDVLVMEMDVSPGDVNLSYIRESGTSFSAPLVAASIANFWSQHAEFTNEDVMTALRQHFFKPEDYDINDPHPDSVSEYYGKGIVDVLGLMRHGQETVEILKTGDDRQSTSPGPEKTFLSSIFP